MYYQVKEAATYGGQTNDVLEAKSGWTFLAGMKVHLALQWWCSLHSQLWDNKSSIRLEFSRSSQSGLLGSLPWKCTLQSIKGASMLCNFYPALTFTLERLWLSHPFFLLLLWWYTFLVFTGNGESDWKWDGMILGREARGPVSQTRQVVGIPFLHGARPSLIPSSGAAFSLLCPLVHNKSFFLSHNTLCCRRYWFG
jgi:hypothetical protein